jgi:hypothetical protein
MGDAGYEALVDRCRRRAAKDRRFVGSDAHLALLRDYIDSRVDNVSTVVWDEGGASTSLDDIPIGLKIAIPPPSAYCATDDEQSIVIAAEYAVHEVQHVLESNFGDLRKFRDQIVTRGARVRGASWQWVDDVCNKLEDARLREIATQRYPDDVPHLDAVAGRAIAKDLRLYAEAHGGTPWGDSPADKHRQFAIALSALILLNQANRVTTKNQAVLRKARPHVETARRGSFADVVASTLAIEEIALRDVLTDPS